MSTNLPDRIEALIKALETVKDDTCEEIAKQPENPAIKPISEKPKCFTVSSSELFKHDNLTPFYHSFKLQHEALIGIVQATKVENLVATLEKIAEEGKYRFRGETLKFHPGVIEQLRSILDQKEGAA